jgi:predicted short-subunit dehydrogenase-like oxidoreductase (DUF2520 family)
VWLQALQNLQNTHKLFHRSFSAADASGMLMSLQNELSVLRAIRNALLNLQSGYQAALTQAVTEGKLPAVANELTVQQRLALQHNSIRMEAVNMLLDKCIDGWRDIFVADLRDAGGST